ncbi:hypothetical protein D3C85_949940 [compost metagenome]
MDHPVNPPKPRLGLLHCPAHADLVTDIRLDIQQPPDATIQSLQLTRLDGAQRRTTGQHQVGPKGVQATPQQAGQCAQPTGDKPGQAGLLDLRQRLQG